MKSGGPHAVDQDEPSLSARRAWIEIVSHNEKLHSDRSLSARRAWIEIIGGVCMSKIPPVALRKESVD